MSPDDPIQNGDFPSGPRIAAIAKLRSEKIAKMAAAGILDTKNHKALVSQAGESQWMPVKLFAEGIVPSYAAAVLEYELKCPVHPLLMISPGTKSEIGSMFRGCVVMVPRIETIRHYRAQAKASWEFLKPEERIIDGYDTSLSMADDMGGFEYLYEIIDELRITSPPAAFLSDLETAKALTFGGTVPTDDAIYTNAENDQFLLPVKVVKQPEQGMIGVFTEHSLRLGPKVLKLKPECECPERDTEDPGDAFDWALWQSKADEYKRAVTQVLTESQYKDLELIFYEVTEGSWCKGAQLLNASTAWQKTQVNAKHFALSLEADAIADFLSKNKSAAKASAEINFGNASDAKKALLKARYIELCEVMQYHGFAFHCEFNGDEEKPDGVTLRIQYPDDSSH